MADAPVQENAGASTAGFVVSSFEDVANSAKRGIFYVSQDNYVAVSYTGTPRPLKLYADSATSCVVVIVTGTGTDGKDLVAMAHLSRPGRFQQFFDLVNTRFKGIVRVHASGGNPAEPIQTSKGNDYTAFRNADIVMNWVKDHWINIPGSNLPNPPPGNFQIDSASLSFGQGNPSVYTNNLDCYGIQMHGKIVSRDREWLPLADEDPSGGFQTLFCIFGDPSTIRPQIKPFDKVETEALVKKAICDKRFKNPKDMSDEYILNTFSSTPAYEVPWFCDNIRAAASLVYPKG
jgi:hypothetical protein